MSRPAFRWQKNRTTDCPTCDATRGHPCVRVKDPQRGLDTGQHTVTVHKARREAEAALAAGTTTPQRIGAALGVLSARIHDLDRLASHRALDQTWEANAALLVQIREQVKALRDVEEMVERFVIQQRVSAAVFEDTEVDGVGVVSVHRTANRKAWDHDGLATNVLDRHLIEAGGEEPDPWQVKQWLMDAIGVGYWRVGVIKALGIPVDEFCTTERGRRTVQIT